MTVSMSTSIAGPSNAMASSEGMVATGAEISTGVPPDIGSLATIGAGSAAKTAPVAPNASTSASIMHVMRFIMYPRI